MTLPCQGSSGTRLFAWGVDIDTCAAHFAFVPIDGGDTATLSCVWSSRKSDKAAVRRAVPVIEDELARLAAGVDALRLFLPGVTLGFPAVTIALEDPMGRFTNRPLDKALGAVMAAITLWGPMRPWMVNTSTWKAHLGLNRRGMSKPEIIAWAALAHGFEPKGNPPDHADALGIATYARDFIMEAVT